MAKLFEGQNQLYPEALVTNFGRLFAGFEISGTIECIGDNVVTHDLVVGDPVAVFPHEDIIRQGYVY